MNCFPVINSDQNVYPLDFTTVQYLVVYHFGLRQRRLKAIKYSKISSTPNHGGQLFSYTFPKYFSFTEFVQKCPNIWCFVPKCPKFV